MAKQCVIFDMDGTLSDQRHRLHHIRKEPKDWPAFFDACGEDPPHEYVCWLARLVTKASTAQIIVCSGRPDSHRLHTETWLRHHNIFYNMLMMRHTGDYRPDTVIKKEMLNSLRTTSGYKVLFAVDDRPDVIRMWRENDVPVFAVDDGVWLEELRHQNLTARSA